MSVWLIWLISLLTIPKAVSLSSTVRHTYTIAAILSLSEIIPSPCSRYLKEGLVYIALASPSLRQPFSYLKCTKVNIYLSYNVRSISNTKYTRLITLNSYLVPLLIYYRVLYLIYYYKA